MKYLNFVSYISGDVRNGKVSPLVSRGIYRQIVSEIDFGFYYQ